MSKELIERLALEAWVNATLEDLSPEAVFKRGYCDAMRSIAERGREAVAWHTDDHLTDKSATTYDRDVAERWEAKGWPVVPLYDQGAPCARCAEAERIEAIATAKLGDEIIKNGTLQDNVVKQAAEIERLSSHVEDAKEIIQKMMKAEKQQADRIKALEAFVQKLEYANTEAGNDSIALRRKLVAAESKIAKADAVILHLKETCNAGLLTQGSDFVSMSIWRVKESLDTIAEYLQGGE